MKSFLAALAAVIVIGVVAWQGLQMFEQSSAERFSTASTRL